MELDQGYKEELRRMCFELIQNALIFYKTLLNQEPEAFQGFDEPVEAFLKRELTDLLESMKEKTGLSEKVLVGIALPIFTSFTAEFREVHTRISAL